jgi:SAM-dependent methyltransferase
MTQPYGSAFAQVYNRLWAGFARDVAPRVRELYEQFPIAQENRTVLDLCCGTGQLARHFLDRGYRVIGVDLSEPMLELARQNAGPHLAEGRARFVLGDATEFTVGESVGLVVSTYDSLNHLESAEALSRCFACTLAALAPSGLFVFDLNTRAGLRRWNNVTVVENPEDFLVMRGIYDGESDRAITRVSGFTRTQAGWERFEQTAFNTVFPISQVRDALWETGFAEAWPALAEDLRTPLDDPESHGRVFLVAVRGR